MLPAWAFNESKRRKIVANVHNEVLEVRNELSRVNLMICSVVFLDTLAMS